MLSPSGCPQSFFFLPTPGGLPPCRSGVRSRGVQLSHNVSWPFSRAPPFPALGGSPGSGLLSDQAHGGVPPPAPTAAAPAERGVPPPPTGPPVRRAGGPSGGSLASPTGEATAPRGEACHEDAACSQGRVACHQPSAPWRLACWPSSPCQPQPWPPPTGEDQLRQLAPELLPPLCAAHQPSERAAQAPLQLSHSSVSPLPPPLRHWEAPGVSSWPPAQARPPPSPPFHAMHGAELALEATSGSGASCAPRISGSRHRTRRLGRPAPAVRRRLA
mmetsp:Transcript_96245/g.281094  ORF Transcript_96245/g.281094 Transcript_96245/m.281094 type:complete len:273 (-) Transcript_96245:321-1139(-)